MQEIEKNGVPKNRESIHYDYIHQRDPYKGNSYPPKYIIYLASKYAFRKELSPDKFNAIEAKAYLSEREFIIIDRKENNTLSENKDIEYTTFLKWLKQNQDKKVQMKKGKYFEYNFEDNNIRFIKKGQEPRTFYLRQLKTAFFSYHKDCNTSNQREIASTRNASYLIPLFQEYCNDTSEITDSYGYQSFRGRIGQNKFRKDLIDLHSKGDIVNCMVTGSEIEELIEAAHIVPYNETQDHSLSNGLLLRADIHKLFDNNLLEINHTDLSISLSSKLEKSEYTQLQGKTLQINKDYEKGIKKQLKQRVQI